MNTLPLIMYIAREMFSGCIQSYFNINFLTLCFTGNLFHKFYLKLLSIFTKVTIDKGIINQMNNYSTFMYEYTFILQIYFFILKSIS